MPLLANCRSPFAHLAWDDEPSGFHRGPKLVVISLIAFATAAGLPVLAEDPHSSIRSREVIVRQTPALERSLEATDLALGSPAFIRIFKEEHELEVWLEKGDQFELFRTWEICTWSGELGPKLEEGDGQSPEGFYYVTPRRLNPWSRFHLSFDLGFPNGFDRHYRRTGSALMVHGSCVSIGCYAMTDDSIEEIWTIVDRALRGGQPFVRVHVFPFRMTTESLARHREDEWIQFWQNLAEGYQLFEQNKVPPNVEVRSGRYVFD